jgi:hypothetical protein
LNDLGIVRQTIKDIRRRQAVAFELQMEAAGRHALLLGDSIVSRLGANFPRASVLKGRAIQKQYASSNGA